jgi:hypothetical protein
MRPTKRLIALALAWWAFLACPALAGFSQLPGTGTGGAVLSSVGGNGSTTWAAGFNTAIPNGTLLIVGTAIRNNTGTCALSDSQSNTWVGGHVIQSGSSISANMFYTIVTTPLTTSDTVTVNCGPATGNKGIVGIAMNGVDAVTPYDSTGSLAGGATGTSTNPAIGPSGTLACPANEVNCELVVVIWGNSTGPSPTESTGFTSAGNNGGSPGPHLGFQIVSATTPISYSATNASGSWAIRLDAFRAAIVTAPTNGPLMHAVP